MRYIVRCLAFLVVASAAFAQNAQLTGLILDSSAAAVPNATITVTYTDQGTRQTTSSNADGNYTVTSLLPGHYEILVSADGFQTVRREGVTLQFGQQARVDFTLQPGSTSQSIDVTVDVASVNAEQAESAVSLEPRVLQDLPLEVNGGRRQVDTFTLLVPGATGCGFDHRFNGGSDMSAEVWFNGVPFVFSETSGWIQNAEPPYEAINEFKMVTSVFAAQYGHGQAVSTYNFKSGTNELHGVAFEYVRNDAFDARGFYAPSVAINRQNEYGFALGGPVIIPKIYNGKNRTFFDLNFTWYKYRGAPNNSLYTVPTEQMKQGDFSQYVDPNGNLIPIYDPTNRTPFPNNQVPQSRFSSTSSQLAALIPNPTLPGVVNNITAGVTSLPTNDRSWSYRVDHDITDKQRVSFTQWTDNVQSSYIQSNWPQGDNISGPLGGLTASPSIFNGLIANYTYSIRPNLVMTLGASYNLQNNPASGVGKDTSIHIPGEPLGVAYPDIGFVGPADVPVQLGTGLEASDNRKVGLSLVNDYLWVKGTHNLNLGWEVRRPYQDNLEWCPAAFTFTNLTTSNPNSPNFANEGNPFASFLLGVADSATIRGPIHSLPRSWYAAGFVQDDWKITSKLTLNLGARYDVFVPFTEKYDNISYVNLTQPNPGAGNIPGALDRLGTCSACVGKDQIVTTRWKYIAPRFGFAYSMDHRTVIRGGYALTYIDGGASEFGTNKVVQGFANGLVTNLSYISPNGGVTPGFGTWDVGGPSLTPPPFSPAAGNNQTVNYMGSYQGTVPYIQNWMVGVQRQLPGGILVSPSYVGNKVIRMPSGLENLDQLNPAYLSLGGTLLDNVGSPQAVAAGVNAPYPGFSGTVAQALRPFPQYAGITSNFQEAGVSTYEAFQITAEKRFSKGLQFLVAYTASRNMSNVSSGFSTFNSAPVNTYDRKAEWSLASSDIPNAVSITGIYELPIGPGKPFLNQKGLAGQVLGGWQLGWIAQYSSALPVSISASNLLPLFNGGNRPNLVPGVSPSLSRSNFDPASSPIFNLNAFSQPADFTFGNAPRVLNNLWNFPFYNENITLEKTFKLTERANLQFRAEFFNAFNRVQFGGVNTTYSPNNASFGVVSSQNNAPRQGQLALRLKF